MGLEGTCAAHLGFELDRGASTAIAFCFAAEAPDTTAEAPDPTNEAPDPTTEAPEATSKAPETASKAPEITTEGA